MMKPGRMNGTRGTQRRSAVALALLACAVLATGCLGSPEIEDRWTRLDLESSSLRPYQTMSAGRESVTVRAAITCRQVLSFGANIPAAGMLVPALASTPNASMALGPRFHAAESGRPPAFEGYGSSAGSGAPSTNSRWLRLAGLAGSTQPDRGLADYQWDTRPHLVWA